MHIAKPATIFIIVMLISACSLQAKDWTWPEQMSLGGFGVSSIRGSAGSDGSGQATGILEIPGVAKPQVSLTRSGRGEITGKTSFNAVLSGTEIKGDFELSDRGIKGRGVILTRPKPIDNVSYTLDSRGSVTGNGTYDLGSLSIPVKFSINRDKADIAGSISVQPPSVDTPLAVYKFEGTLDMSCASGKVEIMADGRIQRTGKLANQSSTHPVSDLTVSQGDGKATAAVGGVNVTFKFF